MKIINEPNDFQLLPSVFVMHDLLEVRPHSPLIIRCVVSIRRKATDIKGLVYNYVSM